ncbi:MAG: isopenicillin N synthase family oxygenase, partial [Chromatiales bacterium]|nr:isopenicillin N synthase family oxygenase [Chromatiales bacterium]
MGNPDEIPVVDLSAFSNGDAAGKRSAAKALGDAARGLGFMVVGGHGIDP